MVLESLIAALADGEIHSGAELGRQMGVSRSAVWKWIAQINDLGLEVISTQSKGYRLSHKLELLDESLILTLLEKKLHSDMLPSIKVLLSVDSTNTYLANSVGSGTEGVSVCFAEHQTAGRGRRGREWISEFGAGLCFSLVKRFDDGYAALQGLSLAIGVTIASTLARQGVEGLALKWPNDLLAQGKKLCGILIELKGEHSGPVDVVIGIGINLSLTDIARSKISQQAAAISELTHTRLSRNALAAELVASIVRGLSLFEKEHFDVFLTEWNKFDFMISMPVLVSGNSLVSAGIYRGVDRAGCALVEVSGQLHSLAGGEISLRLSDADLIV